MQKIFSILFIICFLICHPFLNSLTLSPYIELATGKEIGVNRSYGTIGLFSSIPTPCSNLWLYSDIRWMHLTDGTNGACIEEGFFWGNERKAYGGWTSYSWRHWHGHDFGQVAGGLTAFWCPWELDFNVYVPLQNEQGNCCSYDYSGGYKFVVKDFDVSYRIISMALSRYICHCMPNVGIAIGIEPYYLQTGSKNACIDREGWGGKARFLIDICGTIQVEADVSHDRIFDTRAQIAIRMDLLQFLTCRCCPSVNKTFRRQSLIALKHAEKWKFNW